MTYRILGFQGEYRFLSNFYQGYPITYEGVVYPTTEHAYQAAKFDDWGVKRMIAEVTNPGTVKRMAKQKQPRKHWHEAKLGVMTELQQLKFQHPELREKLLALDGYYLEETNRWHDNFWGVCMCSRCRDVAGENQLGRILMRLRDRLLSLPEKNP